MLQTYHRQYTAAILKIGALVSVLCSSVLLARSSWITEPHISTAITIDLLLTLPLAYLFFIRNSKVPKTTVLPVFFLSVAVASLILPAGNRGLLDLAILYFLPLVELTALSYAAWVIIKARKNFLRLRSEGYDVMERLRIVLVQQCRPAFAARAAAFEIGVFYLAILQWRRSSGSAFFTYHKRSGAVTIVTVLLFLMAAETVVVHFLLAKWNVTVAWIVTAASIYFAIQLFAHAKAVAFRPIQILPGRLLLRCGVMGDAKVPINLIAEIKQFTGIPSNSAPGLLTLTPLGALTRPNVKLTLSDEVSLNGFYGSQKRFSSILLTVDEPEKFIEAIRRA